MPNKRGNPNWGQPYRFTPISTEFEMQVIHLHLAPEQYVVSAELRNWCKENRNRYYIPEWLLNEWDICVDPYFSSAA